MPRTASVVQPGGAAPFLRPRAEHRQTVPVEVGALQAQRALPRGHGPDRLRDRLRIIVEDGAVESVGGASVEQERQPCEVRLAKPPERLEGRGKVHGHHARRAGLPGVPDVWRVAVQRRDPVGRGKHPTEPRVVAEQVVVAMPGAALQHLGAAEEQVCPDEAVAGSRLVTHPVPVHLSQQHLGDVAAAGASVPRLEQPVQGRRRLPGIVQDRRGNGHGRLGHALVALYAPVPAGADELAQKPVISVAADVRGTGLAVGKLPRRRLGGEKGHDLSVRSHAVPHRIPGPGQLLRQERLPDAAPDPALSGAAVGVVEVQVGVGHDVHARVHVGDPVQDHQGLVRVRRIAGQKVDRRQVGGRVGEPRPDSVVAVERHEPPPPSLGVEPSHAVVHGEEVQRIPGVRVLCVEEEGLVGQIATEYPAFPQAAPVESVEVVLGPDLPTGGTLQLPWPARRYVPRVTAMTVELPAAAWATELRVDVDAARHSLPGDPGPQLVVGARQPRTASFHGRLQLRPGPGVPADVAPGVGCLVRGVQHGYASPY